jgi:hypothetical protein
MFYILATNPDIQQKLCDEIDATLQGREPSLDDISPNQMPYLNGVVYEALRLYPPVPYVSTSTLVYFRSRSLVLCLSCFGSDFQIHLNVQTLKLHILECITNRIQS